MSPTSKLEARVQVVNRVHHHANKLYPILVEFFTPYVGQKILKADGSVLKKIEEPLRVLLSANTDESLDIWKYNSAYTLNYTIKSHTTYDNIAYYHDVGLYIADLKHGEILEKFLNPPNFKTDYTEKQVEDARNHFKKAKEVYDQAKSALEPFGEYDR